MKNISFIIFILFGAIITLSSCNDAKLKAFADEANKMCPMNLGDNSITKITYEDNAFNYYVNDGETEFDLSKLEGHEDVLKKRYMYNLTEGDENPEFWKLIEDEGVNLKLRYTGMKSGKKIDVLLTNSELLEYRGKMRNPQLRAKTFVELITESINATCPQDKGDGFNMKKAHMDSHGMVMEVALKQPITPDMMVESNVSKLKNNFIELLCKGDEEDNAIDLVKNAIDANLCITYILTSEANKNSITLQITPDEMKEFMASQKSDK